jgi:hypothetical protein
MILRKIDSNNFNKNFERLLEEKKGPNVIKGRFDIEPVALEKKLDFIIKFFFSKGLIKSLTYRILFWEKDSLLINLMDSIKVTKYQLNISYKNKEDPGVIFIDSNTFDEFVFRSILINHFNFEMLETPSLNLRVQICLNEENEVRLIDIYDDRGFDIYVLKGD